MYWLLWLPAAICVLLFVGAFYQVIGTRRDRRTIADYGRLIDIDDGKRMFISEMGFEGPTVIFESGITASNLHWAYLQTNVSMVAQTFSYDRLGLGWSSPCKSPRTPAKLASELHALLEKANVKPPYIFVAHSFGGLIARHFASEYADDVAGLVLLDPMRVEDWHSSNAFRQKLLRRGLRLMERAVPLAQVGIIRLVAGSLLRHSSFFSHVLGSVAGKGGQRMVERTTRELLKMPAEIRSGVIAQWSSPDFYRGAADYFRAVPATVHEMQRANPVKGVPIIVLSPTSTCPLPEQWLRRIGPEATQKVVEKSGHWLHLDRPDVVLDAIYAMLDETREKTISERQEAMYLLRELV